MNWIMTAGFDPQYGGRALTALINGTLANTLADLVANQKFKEGDYITIDVKHAGQDMPLKERVAQLASQLSELGEPIKNGRLPKDLGQVDLGDGRIALVDVAKERFFITTPAKQEQAADAAGDAAAGATPEGAAKPKAPEPDIFGPFSASAISTIQVRAMNDDEKSAYLTKKADWDK
jgi:hypothetical protein